MTNHKYPKGITLLGAVEGVGFRPLFIDLEIKLVLTVTILEQKLAELALAV